MSYILPKATYTNKPQHKSRIFPNFAQHFNSLTL